MIAVVWMLQAEELKMPEPQHTTPRRLVFCYVTDHKEFFMYRFAPSDMREAMQAVGRQAVNPDLAFDWRDALKVEQLMRRMCNARGE